MTICVECGAAFQRSHPRVVCCSDPCRYERHKLICREHARRKYVPSEATLPPKPCDHCGEMFQPYRSNNLYCGRLCQRRSRQARRFSEIRSELRECSRCGAKNVERKPGIPVCDDCKVDKRDRTDIERRRRFRTYGITEADYNAMLERQGHCCAICQTDTPGRKGWAIDHCHDSGVVRGVLCSPCNSAIGLLRDDPDVIMRAAMYVERFQLAKAS